MFVLTLFWNSRILDILHNSTHRVMKITIMQPKLKAGVVIGLVLFILGLAVEVSPNTALMLVGGAFIVYVLVSNFETRMQWMLQHVQYFMFLQYTLDLSEGLSQAFDDNKPGEKITKRFTRIEKILSTQLKAYKKKYPKSPLS